MADIVMRSNIPYSYHTFVFPFTWRYGEKYNLKDFQGIVRTNPAWEPVVWKNETTMPGGFSEEERRLAYSTYQYFHADIRRAVFDFGEKAEQVLLDYHYQIRDSAYVQIEVLENSTTFTYKLNIRELRLKAYNTGVAALVFELEYFPPNFEQQYNESGHMELFHDVLRINQYGRRLTLPYISSEGTCSQAAHKISLILGNAKPVEEDFHTVISNYGNQAGLFYISRIVTGLLGERFKASLCPEKDCIIITPTIDDRMFVISLIRDDFYVDQLKNQNFDNETELEQWTKLEFYNYIYVDEPGGGTCPDANMRADVMRKSVYRRWIPSGTADGISHHSFVRVTGRADYIDDIAVNPFLTMHTELAILSLVQRASLISFKNDAARLAESFGKSVRPINELQRSYVIFNNQYMTFEPTAQEQGMELYNMLLEALYIPKEKTEYEMQLQQLYECSEALSMKKSASRENAMNVILGIIAFISFFFGLFQTFPGILDFIMDLFQ